MSSGGLDLRTKCDLRAAHRLPLDPHCIDHLNLDLLSDYLFQSVKGLMLYLKGLLYVMISY
jgi:hypothetical protein